MANGTLHCVHGDPVQLTLQPQNGNCHEGLHLFMSQPLDAIDRTDNSSVGPDLQIGNHQSQADQSGPGERDTPFSAEVWQTIWNGNVGF
jgi:hypothetical protein